MKAPNAMINRTKIVVLERDLDGAPENLTRWAWSLEKNKTMHQHYGIAAILLNNKLQGTVWMNWIKTSSKISDVLLL